ncbi:activator of Hsp90 ATPase-like protein [Brevibacterium sanguinis]|uniref:Activator of Hsp90 ATPase-like protein n=2 Tax=Brevibacterium TaxID=1696 RepID=A0A366IIA6_9MICO|nr:MULTISPECIES: SRPBCC family protein [Brevibacterium]RBP65094.1 activator of Hsp90 ATPase-like protein [Brevibacterium sanguinis]RBP71357.1 activator of Hsp90 ATPase-like protein [Brevibacterium celere]
MNITPAITHDIDVDLPIARAFALFHEQWDSIKPHSHNPGSSPIVESVFEPRAGGTVFDRFEDGTELHWSRVLVFDPPVRFVITWDLDTRWQLESNPDRTSEVEVVFTALDESRTRVTLEHRGLDRHGPGWEGIREGVDGPGGWPLYLQHLMEAAARSRGSDDLTESM